MTEPRAKTPNPLRTVDCASASLASAKTYWAHDPYAAPDSDNARLATISKQFIRLFYDSLLKRNCRVATGAEIESSFESMDDDALNKIITFINETLIEKEHKTGRKNGIYRAYNDRGDLEITTMPRKPLETIAYTTRIKQILTESTEEFAYYAPDHTPSSSSQNLAKLLRATKLRFGNKTMPDTHPALYGEHLNISLHDTNEDSNSHDFDLAAHNKTSEIIARTVGETLRTKLQADHILLCNSPASLSRLATKYAVETTKPYSMINRSTRQDRDKGNKLPDSASDRIEWHAPDSASDIHLTTLTAMAAIYAVMCEAQKLRGEKTFPAELTSQEHHSILEAINTNSPSPQKKALSQQERITQFQENSFTLTTMKQLVKENVPHAEQDQYNALISEFEAAAIRQSNRQFANAPDASKTR